MYLVYPKFNKLHLVYTWYIFSCHMPCLSMSYDSCPCHKFVRLSGSGQQMKFSRKLHCGSNSAYHSTAFIKHNKIYLPPPRPRTPPFPPALGGDAAGAGFCAPADPAGAGAGSSAGSAGWGGPPAYGASWECRIVPGLSMPSLRSLRPCPAPPRSTTSAGPATPRPRDIQDVGRRHGPPSCNRS